MTTPVSELDQLFDLAALRSRFVPLSPATIDRAVKSGDFPAPVAVGRRRFWRGSDIAQWIASRTPAIDLR